MHLSKVMLVTQAELNWLAIQLVQVGKAELVMLATQPRQVSQFT